MPAALESLTLTPEEIAFFHEQGYLGPFATFTPEEMVAVRAKIDQVFDTEGPEPRTPGQSRHLDHKVVWDVCSHPGIVERMASILGPNLILWRSNFFTKKPGDKEIPWHQDHNYWPLEPKINLTAWVAIDEVTEENSCVHLIPGSHKSRLPHVKAGDDVAFKEMADTHGVDIDKKIKMELKPGEFFLFNENTLHQSERNRSNKRRCGLAVRVTVPEVKVDHEELYPKHRCIVLRGEDTHRLNKMQEPPAK